MKEPRRVIDRKREEPNKDVERGKVAKLIAKPMVLPGFCLGGSFLCILLFFTVSLLSTHKPLSSRS